MTTRVVVYAIHGWPVDVTPITVGGAPVGAKRRVPANEVAEFCVHSGQDLLIHEVQRAEVEAETPVGTN